MKTKDGDKLYHPRTVYVGSVNTEKIAQEIAEYSSLSKGDVKNSIDNLVTVMTRHLQSSEVVMLDGLGTFRLAMKSRGKGAKTKEEVSAAQASLQVHFSPASTRNSDRTVATRSLVTGVKCVLYKPETTDSGNSGGGNSGGGGGGIEEESLGLNLNRKLTKLFIFNGKTIHS